MLIGTLHDDPMDGWNTTFITHSSHLLAHVEENLFLEKRAEARNKHEFTLYIYVGDDMTSWLINKSLMCLRNYENRILGRWNKD